MIRDEREAQAERKITRLGVNTAPTLKCPGESDWDVVRAVEDQ